MSRNAGKIHTQPAEITQNASNFYQKRPNFKQPASFNTAYLSNQNNPSYFSQQSSPLYSQNSPTNKMHGNQQGQGQPYKFYAPVQIIAPTVYLNSSKNTSNLVVKVNDFS